MELKARISNKKPPPHSTVTHILKLNPFFYSPVMYHTYGRPFYLYLDPIPTSVIGTVTRNQPTNQTPRLAKPSLSLRYLPPPVTKPKSDLITENRKFLFSFSRGKGLLRHIIIIIIMIIIIETGLDWIIYLFGLVRSGSVS